MKKKCFPVTISYFGWNLMGCAMDFNQIGDVAEYLQVDDIELFIDSLVVLKTYNDDRNNANQHNR